MQSKFFWGNDSLINTLEKELPESTLYWLFISIAVAVIWIIYLTLFNARVLGLILTAIVNKFVRYGHIKFGSFSFSVLSGKVMFRDVHLVTEDFSVRVQLGMVIFRWWRPLTHKEITEDLSHSNTRLSLYLETFEIHVYNRTSVYARLEQLFGLDRLMEPNEPTSPTANSAREEITKRGQNAEGKWQWRDLIPVIKVEISSGKLVFGNYNIPTTLSVNFGEAHVMYTTKPASTPFDLFMHIIKCRAERLKVMFVNSPKYTGPVDEPPRFMGDGFVVLQSNDVDIYYYHDEPGIVPYEPELVQLANGDVVARRTWPCWGMDVKCGKGTDLSYGPWADRQREYLYKWFYPPDYQPQEITSLPEPGTTRKFRNFDFKMSMQKDCTFDILFTKNKETQAVHMNMTQGSYLEFTVPMVVEENGYEMKINGQLFHLDATTSLAFRSLLDCETFEFNIDIFYPVNWNDHQDWKCDFTACKMSLFFIYHHKVFFTDLIEDWSSKTCPDIFHFVPYTWSFNFLLKEFELVTIANEWNWIDCFGKTPENASIAFCGEIFDLSFSLPFVDYLPSTVPIKFFIRGENVDARLYLPETNTSRHVIIALSENNRITSRDGTLMDGPFSGYPADKKWRKVTQKSDGWVDIMTTPIVAISITYTYHPVPPTGEDPLRILEEPISTPEAEEQLLIPLRLVPLRPLRPKKTKMMIGPEEFDPTQLEADQIMVELEVGPSVLMVYGTLLRSFLHIKENYFGVDQKFTDYEEIFQSHEKASTFTHVSTLDGKDRVFDPRQYRPLHIKLNVTLHDNQAHLVKHCSEDSAPCPSVFLERLAFEMDKKYLETKLQVLVSPAILVVRDMEARPECHNHLKNGHVCLSGLQVRGHAMFSHDGLPLDSETLEYAWLIEVTIGDITGKITAPQLKSIIEFAQTAVFLVDDAENDLQRPSPIKLCQHMIPQHECQQTEGQSGIVPCPGEEDLKYRLTRVSIDCIDLYLVESGAALNIQVYPIRVSTCNLHGKSTKAGVTVAIPHFNVKQFVLSTPPSHDYSSVVDVWLEAGGIGIGPLNVDAAMAIPDPKYHPEQDRFLKHHDRRTRRLWFLWPPDLSSKAAVRVIGKCGCMGGCTFFGGNRNGPKFFQPSDQDYTDGIGSAVYHICTEDGQYGYGQSILQKAAFVFDVESATLPPTPSKSKMLEKLRGVRGSKRSMDTMNTSTTLGDDSTLRPNSLQGYISDHSSVARRTDTSGSEHTLKGSAMNVVDNLDRNSVRSGRSAGTSVTGDYVPDVCIPDSYETDKLVSTPSDTAMTWTSGGSGSVVSLPEVFNKREFGHERKHSYDPKVSGFTTRKRSLSTITDEPSSPTSLNLGRRDSRGSQATAASSGAFSASRQSSLTSPILRRLSSQVLDGSTSSMMGSDGFLSAAESLSEASGPSFHSSKDKPQSPVSPLARKSSLSSDQTSLQGLSFSASGSQTIVQNTVVHHEDTDALLSSSDHSDSESVTSFVSAVSSQQPSVCDWGTPKTRSLSNIVDSRENASRDSRDDGPDYVHLTEDEDDYEFEAASAHPDANLVDLHGQINQPITNSPLLMSCYINHMNQLQCSHWSSPPPLLHLVAKPDNLHQDPSVSSIHNKLSPSIISDHGPATAWIPHFAYRHEGFGPSMMVSKREPKTPPSLSSPSSASDWDKPGKFFSGSLDPSDLEDSTSDPVSKTTAIVNLKGAVDLLISPLMLETLQRYIEAVTPVLAELHPSAIVDGLHFQCSNTVKAQNRLKKRASKQEVAERKDEKDIAPWANAESPQSTSGPGGQSKTSRVQVMFSLSKINISILQASLVEETISFAALDHIRELTCVSTLAVCLDNITCQLLLNNHSEKMTDHSADSSPDSATKKTFPPEKSSGKTKVDSTLPSPETEGEQALETHKEEMVGNLHISRIHFQLRRMKRNSNYSDNVFLTAIPERRSKVLFTFQKIMLTEPTMSSLLGTTETIHEHPEESNTAEDLAGFIMFECGLEDINLKAAKRSGFSGSTTSEDETKMHIDRLLSQLSSQGQKLHKKHSHVESKESVSRTVAASDEDISGLGNSADDEASSWQSRLSVKTNDSQDPGEEEQQKDLDGDASSCVLQFKSVWFNFAAPPPSPKKRKLEFTRLDWNLLSTVTPAINAWMKPAHRSIMASKKLVAHFKQRVSTVMACVMTEALDYPSIHVPIRKKYNKITSLAKTLQEDPSCQLLTVLRLYIKRIGIDAIEENIHVDTIPQLITIQKGLLALTRQWKNVLYMPVETSFKSKKKVQPYTVTFAIPKEDSVENFQGLDDGDLTLDNFDVVDEKTSLLKAEGGGLYHRMGSLGSLTMSLQPPPSQQSHPTSAQQLAHPAGTTPAAGTDNKPQVLISKEPSCESVQQPNTDKHSHGKGLRRNESAGSFQTAASLSASSQDIGVSVPSTPLKASLTRQLSELEKREDEDLYRWMQRQQEYTRLCDHPSLHYYPSVGHDSFITTGLSEHSQDDSISMQKLALGHSFLQLADAQVLFRPLLRSMGIYIGAVKTSAFMKKFGGNVSIQGSLQTLRVDIVDSEQGSGRKKNSKGKQKIRKLPKFFIDMGMETPAFICEGFSVMVCMKDIVDFEKDAAGGGGIGSEWGGVGPAMGGADWRRRSVKAIKFAMEHMEAKPTTTKVNFSLNLNNISQHVNMSLLRLAHQFASMIENVIDTKVELAGQKPSPYIYKTHRKQDSKGSSTGTESQATEFDNNKANVSSPLSPDQDITPPTATAAIVPNPISDTKTAPVHGSPMPETKLKLKETANESDPSPDQHRPDKLPISSSHPPSKSPKKFSFRKSKLEFFGKSTDTANTVVTTATTSGSESKDSVGVEVHSPPHSLNLSDSVAIEIADTSSPAIAEKTIVDEIKENTPRCWRTLYSLLELYSTMPETKTLGRRISASRLSVIDEEPEKMSQTHSIPRFDSTNRVRTEEDIEKQNQSLPGDGTPIVLPSGGYPSAGSAGTGITPEGRQRTYTGSTFTQSIFIGERIPLVVFGMAKVKHVRISAMLSGLKLEATLQNVNASATHRERVKGVLKRKSHETSATAHVGHAMIVLLEGEPPNMQTVVTVNVGKSQGLYSSVSRKTKDHNSALVTVGRIDVDIPQHPVVLHGMVARSSRRLSSTLQEFIRPPAKTRSHDSVDNMLPNQQPSRHSDLGEPSEATPATAKPAPMEPPAEVKPLVIHFKAKLHGLVIGASLLPSLKAQYKMGEVNSSGVTGQKARFTISLPTHSLSFSSKVSINDMQPPRSPHPINPSHSSILRRKARVSAAAESASTAARNAAVTEEMDDSPFLDESVSTPSTLPSSASVDLPPIHIHADYRPHSADTLAADEGLTEGLVLREGHYLNAVAEVGAFEHSLTTDLLNHLVFVQKVFMKEVNEVVQKVSGADQPVPIWTDDGISVVAKDTSKHMLYSLIFRLKGIQITATTPTMNAVRLETGSIELELSNRVQTASNDSSTNKFSAPKLFVKMQVDLNLALGMLMCNPMFEEAEAEFQHLASFATRIGLRNALQDEMIPGVSKDQEALLISLKRPIVFVQPSAFDKAVLVWLNYKNAYEYWNEQRLALNKEVQTATQQVIEKLPLGQISQQAAPAIGTLFLQLTVDDLGICLPMTDLSQGFKGATKHIEDPGAAVVLTLESTQVSACSHGSLVSKGRFTGFCLRFADDFEVSWDDWKPDKKFDVVMNAMVVPEGTYEVCSRTINAIPNNPNSNAKWILNVLWRMTGVDINLDTNIGKRLSTLSNTLTMLTGEEEEEGVQEEQLDDDLEDTENELPTIKVEAPRKSTNLPEGLPDFVYDASLDAKTRARLIENEMNEQAKVVQDLKQLGASLNLREAEERKLQELQSAVFQDFRQDILNRLKRQSVKATALKDKLGLGYKPASHVRSKSSGGAMPNAGKRNSRVETRRLASHREEIRTPPNHHRAQSIDLPEYDPPPKIRLQKHDFLSTTVDDPSFFEDKLEEEETTQGVNPNESFPPFRKQYMVPEPPDTSTSDEAVEDPELQYFSRIHRKINDEGRLRKVPSPTINIKSASAAIQQVEPNVDFELDIKVAVSSGQCVLHPKESKTLLDYDDPKRLLRKESRETSPLPSRKQRKKMSADGGTRGRYGQLAQQQQSLTDNTTVFFLPGVDVKVRYDSKYGPSGVESPTSAKVEMDGMTSLDSPPPAPSFITSTPNSLDASSSFSFPSVKKTPSVKKASMYAWLSLQQLSEEMVISPVLLDFLEQALEPIPMSVSQDKSQQTKTSTLSSDSTDLDASVTSLASGSYAYVSIPVDVVVYIKVKPSLIRFSCVPVSRVECLLRLPSLDLVFSTKRADIESNAIQDTGATPATRGSTVTPMTKGKGGRKLGYAGQMRSSSNLRQRTVSGNLQLPAESSSGGGLSVTGCMADFSLYVFHPYGGGQKKTSLVALEKFESRRTPGKGGSSADDSINSPSSEMARKDSLSLNVEFVKVDVCRSRKGVVQGEAAFNPSMSTSKLSSLFDSSPKAANQVRFSAICDIGSASFKYDMRRLTEILALPKAWYRRTLARRLFLGEEMAGDILTDSDGDTDSCSSLPSPDSHFFHSLSEGRSRAQTTSALHTSHMDPAIGAVQSQHRRVNSESKNIPISLDFKKELDDLNPSRTPSGSGSSPQSPSDEQQPGVARPLGPAAKAKHIPVSSLARESTKAYEHIMRNTSQFNTPIVPGKKIKEWETLVLFAVNLSKLDVMVNMSNVMGNTVWATTDLKSQGRLSIDSSGTKNVNISAGLGGSKLEARGGIVGGYIELHQLHSYFQVNEDPGHEPDHKAGAKFFTLESRLDYMGSSVLMGRISDVGMELSDEWKLDTRKSFQPYLVAKSSDAEVLVHVDVGWDKFHLMISRSTTPDIIKMVSKVEEFLSQQLHSSKRVFISMGPLTTSKPMSLKSKSSNDDASWIEEIRHHRHWQRVLELVSGCKLSMLNFTLPDSGTSLGGSVSLHGNNLTLACYHGINFRSKSWALFTLAEPNICFATGAQEGKNSDDEKCTDIQETLTFQLGHIKTEKVREKHMATILKVSRGHYMPPPFTSVQEWFHYAFATTEIKDLDSFPQVVRQECESPTERRSMARKSQEYNHETEIIFALPSLQMNLQTKHVQDEQPPREDEKKPVVECSFYTEFDDHIFVAMDAELVLFLHDLVTSYVKEKDKGTRTSSFASRARSPESEKKLMSSDPTSVLKQDYREFSCVYWKLEPTVRLISWAGKRIDPVGVDYILQKLGFQHARLTIPKWMQRGAMDPLDKVLSMLTYRIIQVLKEPEKEAEETK